MPEDATFLIVGAGLAGAKAAETLREEGFDGRVVLIGEEVERPYERPPLSKGYLLGTAERDTIYVHPQSWYAEHDVELRLGTTVTGVDPAGHQVTLGDGTQVPYSKLLLATGSSPRRLPVPGADRDGVLYLRRAEDSDRIKATLAVRVPGRRRRSRLDRARSHRRRAGGRRAGDPARDSPAAVARRARPRGRAGLRRPAPRPRG